ncbi:MAG TPA: FAD-linked oxidase C-terminal domain-containing protein [Acidimicrobiales bacterium]|nr:FAD-linked oxidase C-terminal domain-containing protein [Acidimicrobiales bacterium]
MHEVVAALTEIAGPDAVRAGDQIAPDDTHDESLTEPGVVPLAVVRPTTTAAVSAIMALATDWRLGVVARGSGTGLSGACIPAPGGIVVAFDAMKRIVEVDPANQVAVVEPGVTLAELDAAVAPAGLFYPVAPGENSASLGGNVATNAGGMRAIRYGVTRHNVLGLEAVLAGGAVIRTGGKFVKSSAGYDLTQLLIGSEGTLALITEVTVKLSTRPACSATLLAPFADLATVTRAVPPLLAGPATPLILEYLDSLTMGAVTASAGVDLAIPDAVRDAALAYLVVVLESRRHDRLDEDVEETAGLLDRLGALDVYVLSPGAGADLISAREKAFYVARTSGADDILDVVVPRAEMEPFLSTVTALAERDGALLAVCGHVGDGNVHVSVFQPDRVRRERLEGAILAAGVAAGGAISGEHGIGTAKLGYFLALEDPVKVELMARLKAAFDPTGILGPGRIPGPPSGAAAGGVR